MPTRSAVARKQTNARGKIKAGTVPIQKKARSSQDDDITAFLEDMDVELNSRCRMINLEAGRRTDELRDTYSREIIRLPKAIRNMSVREFCEKYGGKINQVLEEERQRVLESTGFASGDGSHSSSVILRSTKAISQTMSMRKTKGGTLKRSSTSLQMRAQAALGAQNSASNAGVACTPAKGGGHNNPLATPRAGVEVSLPETPGTVMANKLARPARRGESIMSINGSPLVREDASRTVALAFAADPSQLPAQLDPNNKEECMSKLMALKDHVASLMETIKSSQDQEEMLPA
mmetsp:Transcript_4006/g.7703  ORF Transcript_4006/g.7703 Transcript_4006/m.7703 type:complete len:291 (-) Transcript_4006:368-1240(-)|eukprot:CAMPEP_0184520296 /NCGR_PEP_ID=MMETSP0198_2-20121128/7087_1 /TAXON_ID=1112570 /ORGANISM="Thraustochytrium sp., Strain LLF1b" /LENGTH=290 /DNA_ID=CAMNT_0026910875 /DNA_START=378 /DNA_END=1250 /DNA_ORIENTATION=+